MLSLEPEKNTPLANLNFLDVFFNINDLGLHRLLCERFGGFLGSNT